LEPEIINDFTGMARHSEQACNHYIIEIALDFYRLWCQIRSEWSLQCLTAAEVASCCNAIKATLAFSSTLRAAG